MFKRIFLFCLFLISCLGLALANTLVSASVDKNYAEVQDEIVLTINVVSNSTDIKNPVIPSLPNFNIYSSGQSRSFSVINGKTSVKSRFEYILSPRFAGKSTVGAFSIEVGGQIYKTEPIEIEVSRSAQSSGAVSPSKSNNANSQSYQNKVRTEKGKQTTREPNQTRKYPDFFMTSQVDKKEAFLNEQINLKIRFYQNQNSRLFDNPRYEKPKMEGFISEDIKTSTGYETLDGSIYAYTEFEYALFGILPGRASVGAATVEYSPAIGNMFDAFGIFFNSSSETREVKSDPLEVLIKPLPSEGKTEDFYGAVGSNFRIETEVDKKELSVGQTLVLTTKISGIGTMRAIDSLPPLDLGPSFRVYDSTSSSSAKIYSGLLGGTKEFKTIIVPRTSGSFVIPPVVFQYFNPVKNIYETVESSPIALHISPEADNQQEDSVQVFSEVNNSGKRVEKISSDIYYLKKEEVSLFTKFLTALKEFEYNYLLFIVLGFALLVSFISKGEFEFLSNQKAYLRAKRNIAKAKTINDIGPVLQEYLSAKQGQPLGLTTIAQSAQNLKLDKATALLLTSFWQELEMLKYAPADTLKNTVALKQSVQKALNLIKQIEKEAK